MKFVRTLVASTLVVGSLWTMGCNQTPAPDNNPKPSPKAAQSSPAAASPAAASPSAAAASPSATAASPSAAAASPKAASPVAANASPGAAGSPGAKAPPPVGFERFEYEDAGVEISVPNNMSKWEKLQDGEWYGSMTPDKKLVLLLRSEEWKEWPDVLKACDKLLHDFKAEGDPKEDKTSDGIKFYYDMGSAKLWDKPYFVFIAGYELQAHDFVLVIAGDPAAKDTWVPQAQKVISSVTRQEKYQNGGGEGKSDE